VAVPDPEALIEDLRKRGLDASRATSSIAVVEPQAEDSPPTQARRMMSGVVFLPAYPGLPSHAFDAVADLVNGCTAVEAVEEGALS
jgi:perosamine synthetase